MSDEEIIKEFESMKVFIDEAIKSVKNTEYWSPIGSMYMVVDKAQQVVRVLKEKE